MSMPSSIAIPAAGTVNLTARALLAKNFLEQAVDPVTAQPYFDFFYGDPVRLVHDWPDFGDLTARYYESCLMVQEMTGQLPATTAKLRDLCLAAIDADGLSYRPATSYSTNSAEFFDQSRTISALCSGYMATGEARMRDAMIGVVDALGSISDTKDGYRYFPGCKYLHGTWEGMNDTDPYGPNPGYFLATLLRPLAKVWELTGYQRALDLAVDFTRTVVEKGNVFTEEGVFEGHVHSRLAATCGVFVCGDLAGKSEWKELAAKAWQFARSYAGPCGFMPELLGEPGTVLRSETCAIMDYLDLTMLLARDGDTAKWGEAERIVRNHLIESQYIRTDWAPEHRDEIYHEMYCEDRAPARMLGGFAGWSAFDQFFGMTECFTEKWVGWLQTPEADPELYYHHPRLCQNCCGPAGLRALYLAWGQAATNDDTGISVNLLLTRHLPEVAVDVAENAEGRIEVRVTPQATGPVRVRIPDWTDAAAMTVRANGTPVTAVQQNGWAQLDNVRAGETVTLAFPWAPRTESYTVRHGAFGHDPYRITFKGDAAIAVEKTGIGMTEEELHEMSVFADAYPLYQRQAEDVYAAEPAPVCGRPSMDWFS